MRARTNSVVGMALVYGPFSPPLLLRAGLLAGHEEPRRSDEEAYADADTECTCCAELEEDGAGDEGADEEGGSGDELVVACDDAAAQGEEAGVRHELHPYGGEDDWIKRERVSFVRREDLKWEVVRTRCGELRVEALAHDTLHAETRAHEADSDETERVRPRGVASIVRDAAPDPTIEPEAENTHTALAALPRRERCGHGEERLDERA